MTFATQIGLAPFFVVLLAFLYVAVGHDAFLFKPREYGVDLDGGVGIVGTSNQTGTAERHVMMHAGDFRRSVGGESDGH